MTWDIRFHYLLGGACFAAFLVLLTYGKIADYFYEKGWRNGFDFRIASEKEVDRVREEIRKLHRES